MSSSSISPFHDLIPDCRNCVFDFIEFNPNHLNTRNNSASKDLYESVSDVKFASKYFKSWKLDNSQIASLLDSPFLKTRKKSEDESHTHLSSIRSFTYTGNNSMAEGLTLSKALEHMTSLEELQICNSRSMDKSVFHSFIHLRNLRELDVSDCSMFSDSDVEKMYHSGIRLKKLNAKGYYLSDRALAFLAGIEELNLAQCDLMRDSSFLCENADQKYGNLRKLCVSTDFDVCDLTDQFMENLHKSGCRLQSLDISECNQMTNHALSFLEGIKELNISDCPLITDAGLKYVSGSIECLTIDRCPGITSRGFQHLVGIKRLSMRELKNINCRKAFKYLEGSIEYLDASDSKLDTLDAITFGYLRGISELDLSLTNAKNLTDDAFEHLTGIRKLNLEGCRSPHLTKKLLFHLTGIRELNILYTDIKVEKRDMPALKDVFKNVTELCLVADPSVLRQTREFIEKQGGVVFSPQTRSFGGGLKISVLSSSGDPSDDSFPDG